MESKCNFEFVFAMKNISACIQQRSDDETTETSLLLTSFYVLFLILLISTSDKRFNKYFFYVKSNIKSWLFELISFVCFVITLPFFTMVFCGFWLNKKIDEYTIKRLENFKGLLCGEDVFWACESENSKFVINILAYVSVERESVDKLIESIRTKINIKREKYPKLFYVRGKSERGHFYWSNKTCLTIQDYVRKLEIDYKNEEELKVQLSSIVNLPMLDDNKALWECLVCDKSINSSMVPIIFRVHHALGDGVALLRFVMEAFESETICDGNYPPLTKNAKNKPFNQILTTLYAIYKAPSVILSNILLRVPDINSIHPKIVTGDQVKIATLLICRKNLNGLFFAQTES